MKSWLQGNETKIYPTNNEEKSVLAWEIYYNLEEKIYKKSALIWSIENAYTDILDNNIYHRTIKINPIDVKSSRYNDFILKITIHILNLK